MTNYYYVESITYYLIYRVIVDIIYKNKNFSIVLFGITIYMQPLIILKVNK